MPTQVTTSTFSGGTDAFNQRKLDRCQDGTLWLCNYDGSSGNTRLSYSKDNGATWTNLGTAATATGDPGIAQALRPSFFIDQDDYAHLVFKQNASSTGGPGGARTSGYLYYMRGTPNAGRTAWTWSTAVQVESTSNAGYAPDFPDVTACRSGTGWAVFIVCSASNGSQNYAMYVRLAIAANGTVTRSIDGLNIGLSPAGEMGTLGPSNGYGVSAHTYPSIDFNHTGDGKTVAGGTPHLYVGWTAGATGAGKGVRFRKAVYSAGAWTWNPERELDGVRYVDGPNGRWLVTHFDGVRAVVAGYFLTPGVDNDVIIYERDAADTTPTTRVLIDAAGGLTDLRFGSASYDTLGNVYLFGRDDTSSPAKNLNWRKWTRATTTLGPINTFDTTGSDAPYISAKRGSQPGNSIEIVYTDGTASPYSVMYDRTVPDVNAPATPYVPAIML